MVYLGLNVRVRMAVLVKAGPMMNLIKITDLAIAWGGQLAFDTIVLAMTLWRSLHIRKLGNHTLIDVLIRDGES